ncbi:hypothetical protein [Winogradskyella sp.]|uniref:hypothetical protein n=1 Tax=Winogradskyella sp. TaxID=1883156 RepID=UPI00263636E6|nr:hypothetical protein [Winogradskyella sp.]
MSLREETLKKYFEGRTVMSKLCRELNNFVERNGNEVSYDITDMTSGLEFKIEKKHIIMLADSCLNNQLKTQDLTNLALVLRVSDYFSWDNSEKDGVLIDGVLTNWGNPEINGELTKEYVQYCAYFLETGEHR